MAVVTITKENFEAEVLHSTKPVLLDFWATWCGPCRMLSPIVDEVAEERADVKVGKVNVDDQPELASQFGVMSIPTLLVFRDGKLVNQAVGARPKAGVPVCWRCWAKRKKSSCMAAACFRMGSGLFALDNMAYLPYTERGKV